MGVDELKNNAVVGATSGPRVTRLHLKQRKRLAMRSLGLENFLAKKKITMDKELGPAFFIFAGQQPVWGLHFYLITP